MDDACIDKIIIPTSECASGMTLMQSIVDEKTGTVIIAKGQVLNEEHILKLKNFKHTEIWVKIEPESSFWKVAETTFEEYRDYAKVLSKVFRENSEGTHLELGELKKLSKSMVKEFKSDYDILACTSLLPKLEKSIYYHSVNVAFLALLLGRWQEYDEKKLEDLVLAALLHDVGKLQINHAIYTKKEEDMILSEKLQYRRHTILGYELLAKYEELDVETLKGVLSHHECVDGSGFPLGLEGKDINDFAKIIGIVDTYDRLKEKYHIFRTIRHLGSIRFKKFDERMLFRFCHNVVNYYIGCHVLLNNGEIGEVAFIEEKALYKPVVKVKDHLIDLYKQPSIRIIRVL